MTQLRAQLIQQELENLVRAAECSCNDRSLRNVAYHHALDIALCGEHAQDTYT